MTKTTLKGGLPRPRAEHTMQARPLPAVIQYQPTRHEQHGKPHAFSSKGQTGSLTRHHGALKKSGVKGGRVPMQNANPPYERPSRKPDANGRRRPKQRGFLQRRF